MSTKLTTLTTREGFSLPHARTRMRGNVSCVTIERETMGEASKQTGAKVETLGGVASENGPRTHGDGQERPSLPEQVTWGLIFQIRLFFRLSVRWKAGE